MRGMEHIVDSNLTRENARRNLKKQKIEIAVYKNQKNQVSVVHSHPYHELILPISGSNVVYSISGGLYEVHLGDMIYIPCEMYHSARFHVTSDSSERMVIQIDERIWKKACEQLGSKPLNWMQSFAILTREDITYWDVRGLFERILKSMQLKSCYQDVAFTAQTVELQTLITQIMESTKSYESGNTSELVNRAVSYLQKHYQEPDLNVMKLAQVIFTSREHLSRAFKQYTMESVHSYLTNLRMQNCCRLLAAGETVINACSESGFSDYTSFLKTFHHLYGITPSEYRMVNLK